MRHYCLESTEEHGTWNGLVRRKAKKKLLPKRHESSVLDEFKH